VLVAYVGSLRLELYDESPELTRHIFDESVPTAPFTFKVAIGVFLDI